MSSPIKLLVITTGGDYNRSIELGRMVSEKNYQIVTVHPLDAKKFDLKPDNNIIPINGWIPETHQYYPL